MFQVQVPQGGRSPCLWLLVVAPPRCHLGHLQPECWLRVAGKGLQICPWKRKSMGNVVFVGKSCGGWTQTGLGFQKAPLPGSSAAHSETRALCFLHMVEQMLHRQWFLGNPCSWTPVGCDLRRPGWLGRGGSLPECSPCVGMNRMCRDSGPAGSGACCPGPEPQCVNVS